MLPGFIIILQIINEKIEKYLQKDVIAASVQNKKKEWWKGAERGSKADAAGSWFVQKSWLMKQS